MPSTKVKRTLKRAKGFYGRAKNCFRIALPKVERAMSNAYISRKIRKRDFRKNWIQQINAATRLNGVSYSRFVKQLSDSDIALNRKVLADIAQTEPLSFQAIVAHAGDISHSSIARSGSVIQHASASGLVSTTSFFNPDLEFQDTKTVDDETLGLEKLAELYSSTYDDMIQPESTEDYFKK